MIQAIQALEWRSIISYAGFNVQSPQLERLIRSSSKVRGNRRVLLRNGYLIIFKGITKKSMSGGRAIFKQFVTLAQKLEKKVKLGKYLIYER